MNQFEEVNFEIAFSPFGAGGQWGDRLHTLRKYIKIFFQNSNFHIQKKK